MTTKLTIDEPVPFYSEGDEDNFFNWLQSIPAVRGVSGTAKGLEVFIEEPLDDLSLYELIALMTRYSLDRRCLRPLCERDDKCWFRDKEKYWYQSIFE